MELGVNQYGVPLQVKDFTGAGKHLFFSVKGAGGDFWKSDGTEAGTIKLKTFYHLEDFTAVNDQVYFTAINGYQGQYQLWKSDGTEAGTMQVKDALGDPLNQPQLLGEVNGRVISARRPLSTDANCG
jgi:ELWxxDGT repeat protein